MQDIADDLGVSLMTVSKALRNHPTISEKTRKRVQQRARELQYLPNLAARSLASRRSHLIGLVIPDLMHSFFAEIAKGAGERLEPQGYQTLLSNSDEQVEKEIRQIRALAARCVDGLILASAAGSASQNLKSTLAAGRMPYVLIDRSISGLDANYVGVDDAEIGCLATTHLIERGCRRIAHIRGPATSTGTRRLAGYRRALEKHGLAVRHELVCGREHDDAAGYRAMVRLLNVKPRLDGVFCYNDPVAAGAMKAILDHGFAIPRDVAVIGVGNIHYSDLLRVSLSTIDQSSYLVGQTAAELLMSAVEGQSPLIPRKVLFSPKLLARESTARTDCPERNSVAYV